VNFSVISQAFEKVKDIIVTWFSVLTRGPSGFAKIDLESHSTLVYALKFMVYMVVADLVLDLPLAAMVGGSYLTGMAVPVALIVEAYVEYLTVGLILFGALKLMGGRGRLQPCVAAYCLLTAYMPLISFLFLPSRIFITIPVLLRGEELNVNAFHQLWDPLSAWNHFKVLFSVLLITVVFVLFFRSVFQEFRILHQLTRARAIVGFIGGLAASAAVEWVFLKPATSLLYRALVPHPP
jgi:hypothetical protein